MVEFCNKPLTKPDWVETFKKSHFVAHRGPDCLWIFDPELDREPMPGERQSTANYPLTLDPMHFGNFCTAFDEIVDITNTTTSDMLLVGDAKHELNFANIHKHIKKRKEEFQVVVAYKECQITGLHARGRRNVVEHVSIFSVKPLVPHHEQRLFYTLTTCATNLIAQVDMLPDDRLPHCKKSIKEEIHTSYGLPRTERSLGPDVMVPVMSKEKHICLWREHLHATKATRCVIATPGGGVMIRACVAQGMKAFVFFF